MGAVSSLRAVDFVASQQNLPTEILCSDDKEAAACTKVWL